MDNLAATNRTLQTQRVILATPQAIFETFQRPEFLAKWWGPRDFTNTFEKFDFVPNGRWVFVMHGPDGTNYPNENVFQEITAYSKVVIRHIHQPLFTLTVTLEPTGDNTLLTWVQEFDSTDVANAVRHICEPANEQNLDRLEKVLGISAA